MRSAQQPNALPPQPIFSPEVRHTIEPGAEAGGIALIGNFLPRRCGIATFTSHVYDALHTVQPGRPVSVVAMEESGEDYAFPSAVTHVISQDHREAYRAVGRALAREGHALLWIQHEFGIYGGAAGDFLIDLIEAARLPMIVTLHTVLAEPSDDQHRVLAALGRQAGLLIVMADHARGLLRDVYGVAEHKIAVIPHGVPDRAYVEPWIAKEHMRLPSAPSILTFGLLSPGKGLEQMILAMPAIVEACPDACYWVAGATHPHLLAREGEAYRHKLRALADDLGVSASLRWIDGFLTEQDLLGWIAAADIYVTPYRNPEQITSGTLAYAAALGKTIVSTPYPHARELLADGRGRLVRFGDHAALGREIAALLGDDLERARLARSLYRHCRTMTWSRMASRTLCTASLLDEPAAMIPAS